jgi:hypothetical protein
MKTTDKKGKKDNEKARKTNYNATAALGTFIIIAAAIFLIAISNMIFPFLHGEMNEMMMFLSMNIVSMFMLALSIYLTFVYLRDYLELRSKFTFGILMAVIAFMMFAITSTPLLHWFLGIYGRPGMFSMVPYVFATISLAILAWVSSR